MSITVKLFASLRERLNHQDFSFELDSEKSISEITTLLSLDKGHLWLDVLNEDNVIVAVNQTIVDRSHKVKEGDELAYFPPVTGG